MANATWPTELPSKPLVDGFDEQGADNVIRSEMDAGPNKVRRRSTAAPEIYRMTFEMSGQQVKILKNFYHDTLLDGSLKFDMSHPRTGDLETWQFKSPYRVVPRDGTRWRANIELSMFK